jgi:dipeptidyl aminopeptidase/acylaminoacyl peptidase
LSDISPVEQAGRIDVPVLLVQGRRDCDIPAVQTEAMEQALSQPIEKVGNVDIDNVPSRSAARPPDRPRRSVTAVYLDDADHALSRASDRIAYLSALETFLAANLRPGAQPGS